MDSSIEESYSLIGVGLYGTELLNVATSPALPQNGIEVINFRELISVSQRVCGSREAS